MMWGYSMTGMGWWMVVSLLLWLVLLGLLGVAVWAFARWVAHQTQTGGPSSARQAEEGLSAVGILRQRFARGELDSDTFERMRRQLEASSTDQPMPTAGR
jgi:putative membrane protein